MPSQHEGSAPQIVSHAIVDRMSLGLVSRQFYLPTVSKYTLLN